MTDSRYNVTIVGGGIVGLAVALEITRRFPRIRLLLLEKEDHVGRHQSGHNSGVIHSGIYYKPGSLKAKLCVAGAAAMVEFCREHGIPHQICGKVIVATEEEEFPRLDELWRRGIANGLTGLKSIGPEELREIEPNATGLRAIVVPSTGITNYATVCDKYAELITAQGGTILTSHAVRALKRSANEIVVETNHGAFSTASLINCAGLFSDRVSRMAGDDPQVMIVPFRGEYYDLIPERASWCAVLSIPCPIRDFHFSEFISLVESTARSMPDPTPSSHFAAKATAAPISICAISPHRCLFPDSGAWAQKIGAAASTNFSDRFRRPHSSAPCSDWSRMYNPRIWSPVGPACAPKPSRARARWWMISSLFLQTGCCMS